MCIREICKICCTQSFSYPVYYPQFQTSDLTVCSQALDYLLLYLFSVAQELLWSLLLTNRSVPSLTGATHALLALCTICLLHQCGAVSLPLPPI